MFLQPFQQYFTYAPTRDDGSNVLQWTPEVESVGANVRLNWHYRMVQSACEFGHLDTMKWLLEERAELNLVPPGTSVSEDEHVAILTWLETTPCRQYTVETMKKAALTGCVRVLQYLHVDRQVPCTVDIMDLAVANGHINVLEWLEEVGFKGRASSAVYQAAAHGDLDVVQWLDKRFGGDINMSTLMAFAAANGHLEMVESCLARHGCAQMESPSQGYQVLYPMQWLDQRCQQAPSMVALCNGTCIDRPARGAPQNLALLAVQWGDLQLLEYLYERHRDCFEWPPGKRNEVHENIAPFGHAPIVEWLDERYH